MPPEYISLVVGSRLIWLDAIHEFAEKLCHEVGLGEQERFDVGMALREALNNAIVHGNRQDERKHVDIRFLLHPDGIEIRVRDEGPGFAWQDLPDPLAPQNLLRSSGRGLFLMRSYMDEVDLLKASEPGGEVRMKKRFASLPGGANDESRRNGGA